MPLCLLLLEHLGRGHGIGPKGDDFNGFTKNIFDPLNDGAAYSSTLTVNHTYSLHVSTPFN
jgi:hypothetical protein